MALSFLFLCPLVQLDSKSCPLALLAKTCSQIGADSSDIGTVVGNGNSNLSTNSSINNAKVSSSQHRDGILKVSNLYERNGNLESNNNKSRGNISPADVIFPTSLSTSKKSPTQSISIHNNNSDKNRAGHINGRDQDNKTSSRSRSSSVEINLTSDAPSCLISPTKDTSSLSSLSSLSSSSSSSRKSPCRGNDNNDKKSNKETHNSPVQTGSERPMPPLIRPSSSGDDLTNEDIKASDMTLKSSRSSNLLPQASESPNHAEQGIKNSKKSDNVAKNGLDALVGHPRDLPLGTYLRNNVNGTPITATSELQGLQNYLMYQGLSNFNQSSPCTSSTLSPHLALALAAGSSGRNPFLPSTMSTLTGSVPSGGHPVPPSGICRDPMCRDPLCPTSMRNQQLLAAATGHWPASSVLSHYSSLLSTHQRESMISAAQRQAIQASMLAAAAAGPPGSAGGSLPYVCNWVSGRFITT